MTKQDMRINEEMEQELGICSKCGAELEPIYETVDLEGHHTEITGFYSCSDCNDEASEDDTETPEELNSIGRNLYV